MDRRSAIVFSWVEINDAKRRHMALGPVDLVEVDHIGFKTFETGIAGIQNVLRGHA